MRGDLYRLRSARHRAPRAARPTVRSRDPERRILLSTLIVAPTSTSAQPAIFRPEIEMDGTRTLVLIDQMRAVDASRLGDVAGRLDEERPEKSTEPSS